MEAVYAGLSVYQDEFVQILESSENFPANSEKERSLSPHIDMLHCPYVYKKVMSQKE